MHKIVLCAFLRGAAEDNEARRVEALQKRGIDKWFQEKISAKDANRPQLQAMLDFAREGDTTPYIAERRFCLLPLPPITSMSLL